MSGVFGFTTRSELTGFLWNQRRKSSSGELCSTDKEYSSSVVATVYSQLTTVVGGSIVGTVVGGN